MANAMTREELDRRITERMPHSEAVREGALLVERAKAFAIKSHGDQQYDGKSYSVHLDAVELVLIEFNHVTSILRAGAWLHDVLEDTDVTLLELEMEFPGYVALIVEAVTSEPGKNRRERNIKTYPKIEKYLEAIILKLADRIANVRNCINTRNAGLLAMYKKEYSDFRLALKNDHPDTKEMWFYLDILLDYKESNEPL